MSGTSMAAPHVTGAIALLLQHMPALTMNRIRRRLELAAISDAFTGVVPNDDWGAGKLKAL
jgi:subtilisin family serine protease